MQRISPPAVRPGEPVRAWHFAQMSRAIFACRLIAGAGVRLVETAAGTIINFHASRPFVCAWQVSLRGAESATIRPGTVNKIPATIKGVPLDGGKDSLPPPVLEWAKLEVDDEGRGYVCLEVTCDPLKKWTITKAEIVQVAEPDTDDGKPTKTLPTATGGSLPLKDNRARHPLAMLRQRADGRLDVFQITCFDLQHRVKLGADGKTAARHFFW